MISGDKSVDNIKSIMAPVFEADKTRIITYIGEKIINILNDHPNITLQMIESSFRDHRCWSYLIAKQRGESMGDNFEFRLPKDDTPKTYHVFLSTHDPETAMKELLSNSGSYEENFEKLNDTGFIMQKNNSISILDSLNPGESIRVSSPEAFRALLKEAGIIK